MASSVRGSPASSVRRSQAVSSTSQVPALSHSTQTMLSLHDQELSVEERIGERLDDGREFLDLRGALVGENCVPRSLVELAGFLTVLDLSSNHMVYVPEFCGKLSLLQSLTVADNRLAAVPKVILQLKQLTFLDLSGNQITMVCQEIVQLSALETLLLARNLITIVQGESLSNMTSLQRLDLSHNQLTTIPQELMQAARLAHLELRGNPLQTPPIPIAEKGWEAVRAYWRKMKDLPSTDMMSSRRRRSNVRNSVVIRTASRASTGEETLTFADIHANAMNAPEEHQTIHETLLQEEGEDQAKGMNVIGDNSMGKSPQLSSLKRRLTRFSSRASAWDTIEPPASQPNNAASLRTDSQASPGSLQAVIMRNQQKSEVLQQRLVQSLSALASARSSISLDRMQSTLYTSTGRSSTSPPTKALEQDIDLKQFDSSRRKWMDARKTLDAVVQRPETNHLAEAEACLRERSTSFQEATNAYKVIMARIQESVELMDARLLSSGTETNSWDLLSRNAGQKMKQTDELMEQLMDAIREENIAITQMQKFGDLANDVDSKAALFLDPYCAVAVKHQGQLLVEQHASLQLQISVEELCELVLMLEEVRTCASSKQRMLLLQKMFPQIQGTDEETLQSTQAYKCKLIALAHYVETVAKKDYPEIRFQCPQLMAYLQQLETAPFVSYTLASFTEVLPTDVRHMSFMAVNPYGKQSRIRKFLLPPEKRVRFEAAVHFLYSHPHPVINPLYGAWYEGGYAFIEEQFCDGVPVREWFQRQASLGNFVLVQSAFGKLLEAFVHLHRHGFHWGYFTLDSLTMAVDKFEDNADDGNGLSLVDKQPRILLDGFDFSFSEKLLDLDAPESHLAGKRLYTCSTDLYYFGCGLCELVSITQAPPTTDTKTNAVYIPPIIPRWNSKHLPAFLSQLLSEYPEYRASAEILLSHPYFTVDRSSLQTSVRSPALSKGLHSFYENLFADFHTGSTPGICFVELDNRHNLVIQFLNLLEKMSAQDLRGPLFLASHKPKPHRDLVRLLVDTLVFGTMSVKLFECTRTTKDEPERDRQLFVPHSEAQETVQWESIGKLFAKLILDGSCIPQYFPLSFYKALLLSLEEEGEDGVLSMSDLEQHNVSLALHVRFQYARDERQRSEKVQQTVYQPHKMQYKAIRQGMEWLLGSTRLQALKPLDLIHVLHGRVNDHLSVSTLRNHVELHGFTAAGKIGEGAQQHSTITYFWLWIDGLAEEEGSTDALRMFLLFATSRYHLPVDLYKPEPCGHPHYLLDPMDTPLIFLHETKSVNATVRRGLSGHLELSTYTDFAAFEHAMSRGMQEWFLQECLL